MKKGIVIVFVCIGMISFSQSKGKLILKENKEFRAQLNHNYKDSTHSPLTKEARLAFDSLPFYPIDTNLSLTATFKKVTNSKVFGMKTSTNRKPKYKLYGIATFKIKGVSHSLNIYQNQRLVNNPYYKNHLFLPFNDYTNGNGTYGGGRYIDLRIPTGNIIVIDFNKAYNPYCAYTSGYSCPVPPRENLLRTEIKAGVKFVEKGDH